MNENTLAAQVVLCESAPTSVIVFAETQEPEIDKLLELEISGFPEGEDIETGGGNAAAPEPEITREAACAEVPSL